MKLNGLKMILLILIVMTGMCGCTMNTNESKFDTDKYFEDLRMREEKKRQEIVKSVKGYLKEKYGEFEFEISGVQPSGFDHSNDLVHAYLPGGDEDADRFDIMRYHTEDGYEFEDTYFGLLIRDDYEAMVSEVAKKYFPEFIIDATPTNLPNYFDSNSTLEDALAVRGWYCNLRIMVAPTMENIEAFDLARESFIEAWKNTGLDTTLGIWYLDEGEFEMLDRAGFSNIIGEEKYQSGGWEPSFNMDK